MARSVKCSHFQDDTHKNTQIYVAEQSIQEPIVTKKIDDYCQHQSDNRNVTTGITSLCPNTTGEH